MYRMWFKDKKTFVKYGQLIPIIFGMIWIIMMLYTDQVAPKYPDEENGKIYPVKIRGGVAYIDFTEKALIIISTILTPVSVLALILISNYFWKDAEENSI